MEFAPMPRSIGLRELIRRRRYRELTDRLVREVVERCERADRQWDPSDLRGRSVDFLRGFVRAKLARPIRLAAENAIRRHGADTELRPVVTVLAAEQLVDSTVRRVLNAPAARKLAA